MALWAAHIGTASGRLDDIDALHNMFVFEDLAAGAAQGFVVPGAGGEGEWARENMGAFKRREKEGDGEVDWGVEGEVWDVGWEGRVDCGI